MVEKSDIKKVFTYSEKVIISGDIIEFYGYKKKVFEGYSTKGGGRKKDSKAMPANREKNFNRAKTKIRRLCNTNICENSKFVTLTFKENMTDIDLANKEFNKFIKRLKYKYSPKIDYIAVIEFQKRGAVHYHCLFFNVPYISNKELREVWGNGFVKINKIDKVDNVGAYVCKYMTKTDDDRLAGRKMWFSSRDLKQPTVIKDDSLVESVRGSLQANEPVYKNTFVNDYNTVNYLQYNINRKK